MKKLGYRCAKLALAVLVLLLAACGGGGGSGGGGSDLSSAPGLALSPTSLSFTAVQNGALPSTQNVQVTITHPAAFGILAGFPTGVTPPTWVDQNSSFSCTPSLTFCTLALAISTTSLAPGTYTTTIRFVIGDRNDNALALRDLQVSYTVQPLHGFAPSPASLSFSQLRGGAAPSAQNILVSELGGASYPWNVSISYQSGLGWLNVNSASGVALPTTLSVSVNPQIALGTLNATLHMTGNGNSVDIPVSYTLSEPTLTRSPASLAFSALRLASTPPTQDVTLTTQGSIPVNYTTSVSYGAGATGWLSVPAGGTAPGTVTAGVNTTALSPGSYTATLSFNTAAQSVSVSVTYAVSEPVVIPSPPSLSFSAFRLASAPAAQDVTLGTQSNVQVAFSTSVTYGPGASGWLSVPAGGTAPTTIAVGVNTVSLQPATYTATLVVNTPTRTISIPVTYVLSEPTLTRSPSQLTFNAISGGTLPATQDITVSTQPSVSLDYSTLISYGAGANGWLSWTQNGPAPGTVTMGVNTTALAPATYTATLSLNTATQTVVVSISYVVAGSSITFSPGSASFVIDTISTPSALSQTVAVGSTGVSLSWTALASPPWVKVSPTSGSSGTSVTLSLDAAQLDTLDAGTQSATISFAYTPPNQTATSAPLAVSLDLQIPKVDSVNPYVATSGTSMEVILRGSGFANPGGTAVDFDGNAGSIPTVVSDTELRLTHPSLAAGSYRVSVPNQLGNPAIVRSTANLVVVGEPTYLAATIAYPDATAKRPLRVVYDAERRALLIAVRSPTTDPANGTLYRYTLPGTAWSATPATASIPDLRDFAMGPGGKQLIVAHDGTVRQVNPATLATGLSASAPFGLEAFKRVAVANDGNAILTVWLDGGGGFMLPFHYSIRDNSLDFFSNLIGLSDAGAGASADGSRVILPQNGTFPAGRTWQYSASTSTLSATDVMDNVPSDPTLDRKASRILIGSSVYDGNFSLLGSIDSAPTTALSPDGSRAYAYSSGTTLHTYDLTATPVAGSFPEILPATTLPSDPGASLVFPVAFAVMTVSGDGGAVFIAGKDGIVVVPAP